MKFGLAVRVWVCFLLCLPGAASAHASFHVGIGYHSGFHGIRHPCYGWHGGYYGWGHHYRARPWCSPRVSFWVGGWYPDVIVGCPVVVEAPRVVVKKEVVVRTIENNYRSQSDEKTQKLFKDLRGRKAELLRRLRLGDDRERKEAIGELGGFSFDPKVRKALEEILLSEPDAELRIEAMRAFGKVKNRDALGALEKARVEDTDMQVRQEADRAIKEIEGS